MKTFYRDQCAIIYRPNEEFGALSNFSFLPITLGSMKFRTSEHLYQCFRFTHESSIQQEIIDSKTPREAKDIANACKNLTRKDWFDINIPVMEWVLRIKLFQNWDIINEVLAKSIGRYLVEESKTDDFWGAIAFEDHNLAQRLQGQNKLGELRILLHNSPSLFFN